MLSNIFNPKRTVSDVMSVFAQAITDLETVATAQTAEAERQTAIANDALSAAKNAKDEAANAVSVRAKLSAIINP